MKKINIITICILFLLPVSLMARGNADAYFTRVEKTYTLNEDGSQVMRIIKRLKINSHKAMNNTYGETFINYNPEFQTLKINDTYVIQSNGHKVKPRESAFVECLPSFAANAAAFSNLKQMVVVHTGLDLGCTIYIDYTITTKAGYFPALDVYELLREKSPVNYMKLSFNVPKNIPLNVYVINEKNYPGLISRTLSTKNKMDNGKGQKTIKLTLKNVPAATHERFATIEGGDIQMIVVNTYQDNKEAIAYAMKQINNAGKSKVTNVKDAFSIVKIPYVLNAYRLRNMTDVDLSAYATEVEMASILKQRFIAKGQNSELIFAYPFINKDKEGKTMILGLAPVKEILIVSENKNEALGKYSYYTVNGANPIHKYAVDYMTFLGEDHEFKLDEKENIKYDYKETFNNDKIAQMRKDSRISGESKYFFIPLKQLVSEKLHIGNLNTKRTNNFLLQDPINQKMVFEFNVPDGIKLQDTDLNIKMNNKVGSLILNATQEGNIIKVKKELNLNSQLINKKDYRYFRILMQEWMNPIHSKILCK
ncbi:MAG: DUF3857 domain-containing protein [Bacteroidales bacterium]